TRSVNTRRIHRIEIKANEMFVWASTTTGFGTPGGWAFVQRYTAPNNVQWWGADTSAAQAAPTNLTPTTLGRGTSIPLTIDYKPDGSISSTTGKTIYVNDTQGSSSKRYRVVVYRATGSAYARSTW